MLVSDAEPRGGFRYCAGSKSDYRLSMRAEYLFSGGRADQVPATFVAGREERTRMRIILRFWHYLADRPLT
jgi:hypothetical protein